MVVSVFMVQTIARKSEALCWHSSYGLKPARSGAAFCVTATQNDAGESAITGSMNGASVTALSLPESQRQKVRVTHHLWRTVLVREREVFAMTLTPPWAGNETARRPAQWLLD
jgi:hypothetical protein